MTNFTVRERFIQSLYYLRHLLRYRSRRHQHCSWCGSQLVVQPPKAEGHSPTTVCTSCKCGWEGHIVQRWEAKPPPPRVLYIRLLIYRGDRKWTHAAACTEHRYVKGTMRMGRNSIREWHLWGRKYVQPTDKGPAPE